MVKPRGYPTAATFGRCPVGTTISFGRNTTLVMECDRFEGLVAQSVAGGHMSSEEAMRCLNGGVFSLAQANRIVFVHFGDNGPKGPTSTYVDWCNAIIDGCVRMACQL
jgi:hypothetical protein